ncbi:MAG TPA: GntR family transcriptional regulator [Dehalococcoidia bacterium]|nr:GntR family transcriptional regulator [Dehalococcoidia bacterium]
MLVARKGTLPLYHQLREFIRDRIETGEWAPGHRLPGESDLQVEFGVSRATVRQALQLLENEGLIERFQGRGTFVGRPKIASNLLAMFTSDGLIRDPGSQAGFRLIHSRKGTPSTSTASRLKLQPNEQVHEIKRTIVVDGEHLMLITSWLPESLVPDVDEEKMAQTSLRQALRERYGFEIVRQHKEVEVTILDEEEAAILGGHPGAPAMLLTYLNFLTNGRPLEDRKIIVRGDRCKYFIDLDTPELVL